MVSEFINDKRYNWKIESSDTMFIAYKGRHESIKKILTYLTKGGVPNVSEIKEITNKMVGNFVIVVETEAWIFGLVDRIGGYRLFYKNYHGKCILSNSPRQLVSENQDRNTTKQSSIVEIKMAGYLTGNTTIYDDIHQLCAGELLLFNKNQNNCVVASYFKFYSPYVRKESNEYLIKKLDDITNTIIKRNIEDSNGRMIWVPLSGGLDSRLIVCKLKQLGCDNMRTYSYGVAGNFDAIRAKEIAHTLDLKWDFLPTSATEARRYFLSKERKDYWNFADGLSVIPNSHGTFALNSLIKSGKMKSGDVIINGQSGDFITGQHIPILKKEELYSKIIVDCILKKNYSLRDELFRKKDLIEMMKARVNDTLGDYKHVTNYQDFAKSYEYWGWKERQSKRVINGQSNYDYLGLNWELPFWDLEYLKFWVDIPLHQKIDRNLFVEYLNKMNFYGLFKNNNKFMSRWPLSRIYIQFMGNILSKFLGKDTASQYYKKLDWYSQYEYLYALTGKAEYNKHWSNYKGGYPYKTDIWLTENLIR